MYLIAVAGLPGSGKTTLAEYLSKKLGCTLICKDSVKEIMYDTIGFHNRTEKTAINNASLEVMFYFCAQLLRSGGNVILENNYENNAYPYFEKLDSEFGVNMITVLVGGDMRSIYDRYVARNSDPSRHRGHVLSTEYPEQENVGVVPEPISFEYFSRDFTERGMTYFHVGKHLIEVDATDFSRLDYEELLDRVAEAIGDDAV